MHNDHGPAESDEFPHPNQPDDLARLERTMRNALREAADEFRGPSPDLVRRGVARGRARRLRGMAVRSAGAAAAVTLVMTWAVAAGGWPPSADTAPSAGRETASRTARPGPDLSAILRAVTPREGRLENTRTYFDPLADPFLQTGAGIDTTYVTAAGSSRLSIRLTPRPVPGTRAEQEQGTFCREQETAPGYTCGRRVLPDGSVQTTAVFRNVVAGKQNTLHTLVTRPDGVRVRVDVSGDGATDAPESAPMLSADQLAAMAASPLWNPVAAMLPTPERQLAAIMPALLPPGYGLASRDGHGGSAWFVLTNSLGATTLSATVVGSLAPCPGGDTPGTCASLTLPGGIQARIEHNRDIGNGVTAPLTLTFASRRGLVIRLQTEPNSPWNPTRDDPAARLGEAQLKAMAQSPLLH